MPFRIVGTSPMGSTWFHSCDYRTPRAVRAALVRVVEKEASGPIGYWESAKVRGEGLRPGESIELPNGWVFRIEAYDLP